MRLNTAALFQLLLRKLQPELVCDVGAMDGYHSLRFRQLCPNAQIVAFEANPNNLLRMRGNADLAEANITIVHKAVWNKAGTLDFFVQPLPEGSWGWQAGISSTRRTNNSLGVDPIEMEAVRLDEFVEELAPTASPIALWIDVEGAAFEVLEGIQSLRDRVALIHVEVETHEVWHGQQLKPAIQTLLTEMGFVELARGTDELQHDLVFVHRRVYEATRGPIKSLIFRVLLLTAFQNVARPVYRRVRDLYLRAIRKNGSRA